MACFKNIIFIFLVSFCIVAFCSSSCFAVEWTQEEIDGLLSNLAEMQKTINTLNKNLQDIHEYDYLSSERLQIILNNLKSFHRDMNSKMDSLQSASTEINKNLVYCLNNLQDIKALSTEMSINLASLKDYLKEVNTNIQSCLTNLQTLNEKIDQTNLYLESIDANVKDIRDAIVSTNENLVETNQKLDDVNKNITDTNVNTDSSTLPSDTTDNITISGFNHIFETLYNTFTTQTAQDLVITIPFTKKSFTINFETVYAGVDLGFLKTLIELFWYFIISYFIVHDIAKKINKIKSGDIENVQQYNIKEDLL